MCDSRRKINVLLKNGRIYSMRPFFLSAEITQSVCSCAVFPNFKMKMVTRASSGCSDIADYLSFFNLLTVGYANFRAMSVKRFVSVIFSTDFKKKPLARFFSC